jgi:hypothetical protein
MQPQDLIEGIAKVFGLVTSSSSSALLSVVGFALLTVAGILAYVAVKSKPGEMSVLLKSALFVSLIGGMVFSAAGPSVALLDAISIPKMSSEQAFKNLEENSEVTYVVRLISYDPTLEPELAIDRLNNLGPSDQLYSFVASYDELVGYSVLDALAKTGQSVKNVKSVSGIIFPLTTSIFPANARGLLQVVQQIEGRRDIQTNLQNKLIIGKNALNNAELTDLADMSIPSYRVSSFADKYPHYCQIAYEFACTSSYSAQAYLGSVSRDWHPLGFSQNPSADRCNLPVAKYCEFKDWKTAEDQYRSSFGSRVFLIRNLEIKNIPGRVLIDFNKPSEQLIPSIGNP